MDKHGVATSMVVPLLDTSPLLWGQCVTKWKVAGSWQQLMQWTSWPKCPMRLRKSPLKWDQTSLRQVYVVVQRKGLINEPETSQHEKPIHILYTYLPAYLPTYYLPTYYLPTYTYLPAELHVLYISFGTLFPLRHFCTSFPSSLKSRLRKWHRCPLRMSSSTVGMFCTSLQVRLFATRLSAATIWSCGQLPHCYLTLIPRAAVSSQVLVESRDLSLVKQTF